MREICNSDKNTLNLDGLSRNQIEDKFDHELTRKWALKVYDVRYNMIKDNEWPLVKSSIFYTYEIEFRDGKYGRLLDVKTVKLNSPEELPIKAEMIMIEMFKDENIFNRYEEITWTADEKVVIKNVDRGRMSLR